MKKDKTEKQNLISKFIEELHLNTLPNSSKVNLVCDVGLLIALGMVVAEPVLFYIESIGILILNSIIVICSNRDLISMREIDSNTTAMACTIALIVAFILCPLVVFLFDGFKKFRNNKKKD